MYRRDLEDFALDIAPKYPVLTIIGPRQSGKSTFVRMVFPQYRYVSLESLEDKELATQDPKGFFKKYPPPLIIDEVQRVPQLLSEIQVLVDEPNFNSQYILTGSHQLLLMESISQSLAGRTTILSLLPLSLHELKQKDLDNNLEFRLFSGGYPRIYDKDLDPNQWLRQYIKTYVERDVRALTELKDLDLFQRFLGLCAGRVGQLINWESLANDCGITGPTAKAWLSILEASFILFRLNPHYKNFGKRIIKSPKIYFYDTALLCALLKINEVKNLESHPLKGAIFENFVILEKLKYYFNRGEEAPFYFWRDSKGKEIDLIIDQGQILFPVEIKSSVTFHYSFLDNMKYFNQIQNLDESAVQGELVYGGEDCFETQSYFIQSWWRTDGAL